MKDFAVVEVGSTNTKGYRYNDGKIEKLGYQTILFKSNYKKLGYIDNNDKQKLFDFVNKLPCKNKFIFGTSIFRNLSQNEQKLWKEEFKNATNCNFEIVSADEESEYTVFGTIANVDYKGNIAVMIGGGGSTEVAIVNEGKVIEKCNSAFGGMDIVDMFPDLAEDKVTTDYETIIQTTISKFNKPQNKADILILAGGDHIYFHETIADGCNKNTLYNNLLHPYCNDYATTIELDKKFFYKTSLDDIKIKTNKPDWWYGGRGMRVCVDALAKMLKVKYVVPTSINMVYGLCEKIKNK